MKVGLFIPCYINAVYPQVGVASYKLLKSLGVDGIIRWIRLAAASQWQMPVLRVNLWKWLVILTESLKIMIT